MNKNTLFLLSLALFVMGCSTSEGKLKEAVFQVSTAYHELDRTKLKPLKPSEEISNRWVQMNKDAYPNNISALEQEAEDFVSENFPSIDAWEVTLDISWDGLSRLNQQGAKVDFQDFKFQSLESEKPINSTMVSVPLTHERYKWLNFVLTEMDGDYYLMLPMLDVSARKPNPN